jgi:hypothetical protein
LILRRLGESPFFDAYGRHKANHLGDPCGEICRLRA